MFQCLSVLGPTSLDYECALPLQNHPINEAVGSRKQRPLGLRRTVVFGRLRLTSASQIPDGRVLIGPLPRASSLAGLCSTVTSLRSNHASAEYNSSGELCLARAARPGRHPVALGAPRGGSHGRSAEALPRRSPVPRARPLEPLGRGLSAEDPSTAAAPLGSPAQQRAAQSFLRSLGLDDAAVRKALGRYPGIVTHSVQRKQKPLVRELKQRFGITRREAGSMIVKAPKLAAVSLEKLQEVDSLLTGALGLKRRDARRCLVRFPNLLNMSVSRNALPTIACLLEMGLTREEVAAMVDMAELSQHPRFFSMSLEKRIAPRVLYMMSRGVDVPSTPLNKILVYGDQKFAERTVGRPLEDFEAFLPSWHLSQAWQGWADVTGVEGEQKQCHGQSVGAPKASASM